MGDPSYAPPVLLHLPRKPENAAVVSMEAWWGKLWLFISVHPVRGELFVVDDPRDYETGHLIHRLNRHLHSGLIGTVIMRWFWFVVTLAPLALFCTGIEIWRKTGRRTVSAAPAGSSGS